MTKKVLFISEYLNPPFDEGIKKTAINLFKNLQSQFETIAITRFGESSENIFVLKTNPLFLSFKVKKLINKFKPNAVIYMPFSSATFASHIRQFIFKIYIKKGIFLFICLQPKALKGWQRHLVRFVKPKIALTPSPDLINLWSNAGIINELIPLLTDLEKFKPINSAKKKIDLRKKHNIPINSFIISHIGHLNEGRNLKALIPLLKPDIQIVVIGSTSTPKGARGSSFLKKEIIAAGIIIIDHYIDNIEEIYQLSDIYLFPVIDKNSSIGLPLSVLEARACSIPVITTNFGSIKFFLGQDYGGIYYSQPIDFPNVIKTIKDMPDKNFSKTNVPNLNIKFFNSIYNRLNN